MILVYPYFVRYFYFFEKCIAKKDVKQVNDPKLC